VNLTHRASEQITVGAEWGLFSGLANKDIKNNEISGCGLLMTEFTLATGLFRTRESSANAISHFTRRAPNLAQLFWSDLTPGRVAKIVEDAGFDLVILTWLSGQARGQVQRRIRLLKDLPVIGTIFEAVRSAVKIPFTRENVVLAGRRNIVCVPLAKMAEDWRLNGVAAACSTREQGYSGDARWNGLRCKRCG